MQNTEVDRTVWELVTQPCSTKRFSAWPSQSTNIQRFHTTLKASRSRFDSIFQFSSDGFDFQISATSPSLKPLIFIYSVPNHLTSSRGISHLLLFDPAFRSSSGKSRGHTNTISSNGNGPPGLRSSFAGFFHVTVSFLFLVDCLT